MRKTKIILPIMSVFLLTGCFLMPSKKSSSSSSTSTSSQTSSSTSTSSVTSLTEFPSEFVNALNETFGESIPFAPFNSETVYYGYDDSYEDYGYGCYTIGDDNENNIFSGYAAKLTSAGYTKEKDEEDEDVYTKTSTSGVAMELYFGFYEASDDYEAGNEIDIFFPISE